MNYNAKLIEIESLLKSIKRKARKLVRHQDTLYQDDFLTVIKDLKEVDNFLK